MRERDQLVQEIKKVSGSNFEALALKVFAYQARHNSIYAQFLELLRVTPAEVRQLTDIPCLPISCFKHHDLRTAQWAAERHFSSSGTTATTTSKHALRDPDWYRYHARRAFVQQYGPLDQFAVLALLPAYLERQGSSLVFMADDFIQQSRQPDSGFYLHNYDQLLSTVQRLIKAQKPILLLGVSFALLDLADLRQWQGLQLPEGSIVMETGGMKGRRRELTRAELHHHIQRAFPAQSIHSEYGMTELLSQAYAPQAGRFFTAPSLRVLCRELSDPLMHCPTGRTGALNCIDLANFDTISFIATDDLAKVYADGSFEVLGRMDHSDTRGCNLLYS